MGSGQAFQRAVPAYRAWPAGRVGVWCGPQLPFGEVSCRAENLVGSADVFDPDESKGPRGLNVPDLDPSPILGWLDDLGNNVTFESDAVSDCEFPKIHCRHTPNLVA